MGGDEVWVLFNLTVAPPTGCFHFSEYLHHCLKHDIILFLHYHTADRGLAIDWESDEVVDSSTRGAYLNLGTSGPRTPP